MLHEPEKNSSDTIYSSLYSNNGSKLTVPRRNISAQQAVSDLKTHAAIEQIVGAVVALPMGLMFIMMITIEKTRQSDPGPILLLFLMTLGGIAFIIAGVRRRKLLERYYEFSNWFYMNESRSLDALALSTGNTPEEAVRLLHKMEKHSLFPEVSLDVQNRRIIFSGEDIFSLHCPNCGGAVTIAQGERRSCEFCGTLISGEECLRK